MPRNLLFHWLRSHLITLLFFLGGNFLYRAFGSELKPPPSESVACSAPLNELLGATPNRTLWVSPNLIRFLPTAVSLEQHHFVSYFRRGPGELKNFYNNKTPKNLFEAANTSVGMKISHSEGMVVGGFRIPWEPSSPRSTLKIRNYKSSARLVSSQAYGPISEKSLSNQVMRLEKIRQSITSLGLRKLSDDFINYYLLIDDEGNSPPCFRTVLTRGQHRVAYLHFLGWSLIPISPDAHHNRAVFLSEASNWPAVIDGQYSETQARSYFLAYFRNA